MKNKFTLIGVIALMAITTQAQTNQPDLLPPIGSLTNGLSSNHLLAAGQELYLGAEALAPFTTNGEVTVQLGYGRNFSDHHQIEAVAIDVPMTTNKQFGVSATLIGEHYGSQFGEGGGTLTFSHTGQLLNVLTYEVSAGEGVIYNLNDGQTANYLYTQYVLDWQVANKWDIGAGILIGNDSSHAGVQGLIGGHVTWRFGKL